MGTSLSGLTPATTFDGLLKVGDNDPLTADLKAISTGDGTDTILQLSNSALQIDGGVTINNSTALAEMTITDNGVTLGSAGNGGILQLARSSGGVIYGKISTDNSQLKIQGANNINNILVSPNTSNGITITNDTTPLGAKLGVKGFGATSATTSLLVQNSAGTDLLKVEDGGLVSASTFYSQVSRLSYINTITNSYTVMQSHLTDGSASFYNSLAVGQSTTPTARLHIKGSGNDNTTTSLLVQNSDGNNLLELTDDGALQINSNATQRFTIANANGDAQLNFRYNIIYTSGGNVLYIGGSQTLIQGGGSDRLIASSTGTTIKGSGATSATTALLVQNSAGTDLLKVEDGGIIGVNGFTIESNIIKPRVNGFIGIKHGDNRSFAIIDSAGTRTYLNVQSSSTSNFADVSVNTDHLVIKKEGNVAVGTSTLDASAKLQVDSTTQGFLPPRMTTAERDAIATPAAGLMLYNTDANVAECWNGSAWIPMF